MRLCLMSVYSAKVCYNTIDATSVIYCIQNSTEYPVLSESKTPEAFYLVQLPSFALLNVHPPELSKKGDSPSPFLTFVYLPRVFF